MQAKESFQDECGKLAAWRTSGLTPYAIFGLSEFDAKTSTIDDYEQSIKKQYKRLALKYHPDKNPGFPDLAKQAFDIIKQAQDYLLFTIKRNPDVTENQFYLFYVQNRITANTREDHFENLIRQGYEVFNDESLDLITKKERLSNIISQIKNALQIKPNLFNYVCDNSSGFNFTTGDKFILYAAAQWNEPDFFAWILQNDPQADPLAKTPFGVSAMGIASNRRNFAILDSLITHYGKEWLQHQLTKVLNDTDYVGDALVEYYMMQFPGQLTPEIASAKFPLTIPPLIHLGHISLTDAPDYLKKAIIGCPQIYPTLNTDERKNTYLLIAAVAQATQLPFEQSFPIFDALPKNGLKPGFVSALCEIWPNLTSRINEDPEAYFSLRRGQGQPRHSNLISFETLKTQLLIATAFIALAMLAYYFWPIIALWPVDAVLPIAAALATAGFISISIALAGSYQYFTKIYPEKRAIQAILRENNFFKPENRATQNPDTQQSNENRLPL